MARTLAGVWIVAWAFFSLPFTNFTPHLRLRQIELVPFHEQAGTGRSSRRVTDAVLNVIFYIPGGALAALLPLTAPVATASTAGFSAVAELSQVFARGRFPSATDFVLNTIGGLIGVAMAMVWRRRR